MFTKPITISLSPNAESDDIFLAGKTLLTPWKWENGAAVEDVESWFSNYFSIDQAVAFNSGRSALLAILKAFSLGVGDEVLVQAFTCVAVPNSVLWAGAKPIYVDIDETLNMNIADAEKKITKNTKAIIIQHTFGIVADMTIMKKFAKKHNLILIEDCAHSLGATFNKGKIGSFGDAAFFSFGRDKVVSSVFGGVAIIPSQYAKENKELRNYQQQLSFPSYGWIFQQLLHPVAFLLILSTYNIYVGKIILVLLQKIKFLSFPVYPEEKFGKQPADFPKKFPNALAILASHQLNKLDRFNKERVEAAEIYRKGLTAFQKIPNVDGSIYLRFPLFVQNPRLFLSSLRKKSIYLGNWYHNVIDPKGVDFAAIGYKLGSCPYAEDKAKSIINLPTRISTKQAEYIVASLRSTEYATYKRREK